MTKLFKQNQSTAASSPKVSPDGTSDKVQVATGAVRIDAAHLSASESSSQDANAAISGSFTIEGLPEHVQRHLQEIQASLMTQQEVLDQRESQLNAHVAKLDAELRRARFLESQAQNGDGDEAAEELDLKHRLEEKQRELRIRELRVQATEIRLNEEREALRQSQGSGGVALGDEASPASGISAEEAQRLQQRALMLESWETELAEKETALTSELQAARKAREQAEALVQDRSKSLRAEQLQWQQQRETVAQQEEQRQRQLDEREAEFAQKNAALQQMQDEVNRVHREALEIRLATEALRAELDDTVGVGQVSRGVKQLRQQIRNDFRNEQRQLEVQLDALREAANELSENHQRLAEASQTWDATMKEKAIAIARDREELANQRSQLESDRLQHSVAQGRWQEQRHEYESEIRRLKAEIRHREA